MTNFYLSSRAELTLKRERQHLASKRFASKMLAFHPATNFYSFILLGYLALIMLSLLFSACNSSVSPQAPTPKLGKGGMPVAPKKPEWKEFVSEEGRFKVLFPDTPRQTFKENDTQNGKVKTTIFDVTTLCAT